VDFLLFKKLMMIVDSINLFLVMNLQMKNQRENGLMRNGDNGRSNNRKNGMETTPALERIIHGTSWRWKTSRYYLMKYLGGCC